MKKLSATFPNSPDPLVKAKEWLRGVLMLCNLENTYEDYIVESITPVSGDRSTIVFILED
jgi:hypothetical protein